MGLDTTHDCWSGSYGTFNDWRRVLARMVGHDLYQFEGFGGDVSFDAMGDDPLRVLLDHSDCDGIIKAKDCAPLANRLADLLPQVPDYDAGDSRAAAWLLPLWSEKTAQFIKGLREAAALGEDVEFH